MNRPTPIQDLFGYLRSSGKPITRENVLSVAKMLSMTEGETALALTMVPPIKEGATA